MTVEYLDTSTEVERYLDPSTIRSLHRTSTTCDCRPRRPCPAIGSHFGVGDMLRGLTGRHTFAHVTLSCGPTRFVCSWAHSPCIGELPVRVRLCCFGTHGPTYSTCFIHMTRIQSRTSDACTCVYVSLLKGTALVVFKNGGTYSYTNVSRRAIANLMVNPNMSLGFWVNKNCVQSDRAVTSGRWITAPCVG